MDSLFGTTVAMLLAMKCIHPPPEWMHNINLYDAKKMTLQQYI